MCACGTRAKPLRMPQRGGRFPEKVPLSAARAPSLRATAPAEPPCAGAARIACRARPVVTSCGSASAALLNLALRLRLVEDVFGAVRRLVDGPDRGGVAARRRSETAHR